MTFHRILLVVGVFVLALVILAGLDLKDREKLPAGQMVTGSLSTEEHLAAAPASTAVNGRNSSHKAKSDQAPFPAKPAGDTSVSGTIPGSGMSERQTPPDQKAAPVAMPSSFQADIPEKNDQGSTPDRSFMPEKSLDGVESAAGIRENLSKGLAAGNTPEEFRGTGEQERAIQEQTSGGNGPEVGGNSVGSAQMGPDQNAAGNTVHPAGAVAADASPGSSLPAASITGTGRDEALSENVDKSKTPSVTARTSNSGKTVQNTRSGNNAGKKTYSAKMPRTGKGQKGASSALTIGRDVVFRLQGSAPLQAKTMVLRDPHRFVVDLNGDWAVGLPKVPAGLWLKNIRIGHHGQTTRLVFDLKRAPVAPKAKNIGSTVLEIVIK